MGVTVCTYGGGNGKEKNIQTTSAVEVCVRGGQLELTRVGVQPGKHNQGKRGRGAEGG